MTFDRAFFLELCCADEAAAEFADAFLRDAHLNDDQVDRDRPLTAEYVARSRLNFLMVVSFSSFWAAKKVQLMPLIIQGAAAFADASEWAKRTDVQDRRAADVLKAFYGEVLWHIAYICGGFDHMRAMQIKYREFNYDATDEPDLH